MRCQRSGIECIYAASSPIGRPKRRRIDLTIRRELGPVPQLPELPSAHSLLPPCEIGSWLPSGDSPQQSSNQHGRSPANVDWDKDSSQALTLTGLSDTAQYVVSGSGPILVYIPLIGLTEAPCRPPLPHRRVRPPVRALSSDLVPA